MGSRSAPSDKRTRARENDSKFGELTGLRIDLYRPAMLFDNDVVTDGQAKTSSFTGGLRRKERTKQLLPYLGRDTGAVVADSDFDTIAEVLSPGEKHRLIVATI